MAFQLLWKFFFSSKLTENAVSLQKWPPRTFMAFSGLCWNLHEWTVGSSTVFHCSICWICLHLLHQVLTSKKVLWTNSAGGFNWLKHVPWETWYDFSISDSGSYFNIKPEPLFVTNRLDARKGTLHSRWSITERKASCSSRQVCTFRLSTRTGTAFSREIPQSFS